MSPLFYEDSLGAKLAEMASEAMDRVSAAEGDFIDDLDALELAERLVRVGRPDDQYEQLTSEWVPAVRPSVISGILAAPGGNAMMLTCPLDAEGIPYVWDPYPPESMPMFRPGSGAIDRPFRILVPAESLEDVRVLLGADPGSSEPLAFNRRPAALPELTPARRLTNWFAVLLFAGLDPVFVSAIALIWAASALIERASKPRPLA